MTEQPNKGRQHRFLCVLLISLLLFILPYIIIETLSWTDRWSGFSNGLFHSIFASLSWCFTLLPWSVLIWFLYRKHEWKRFRSVWVLAPVILLSLYSMGSYFIDPPTAEKRFSRFAKTEFPANAKDLHYYFSGGGLADYHDVYYFTTTPEEVDRLITEMNMKETHLPRISTEPTAAKQDIALRNSMIQSPLEGCPDPREWNDPLLYRGEIIDTGWFFELITDSSKTKVYISISCI